MASGINRSQAEEYLSFAQRLADAAAVQTLKNFRTPITVDNKYETGFDPVTEADKGAERAIRELIESEYPDHGILGEEYGSKPSQSGLTWVLDPIDGTRAYITGSPLWGTLIALNIENEPFLGILDQPYMNERFWGVNLPDMREAGLIRAGVSSGLKTRACASLETAVLSTTHPDLFTGPGENDAFRRLDGKCRMTRYGGDCYSYGLVALGFLDFIVEAGLQAYDIQAIIPIIEGAGGRITSWQGGSAANGGQVIAAGDASAHAAALDVLNA